MILTKEDKSMDVLIVRVSECQIYQNRSLSKNIKNAKIRQNSNNSK